MGQTSRLEGSRSYPTSYHALWSLLGEVRDPSSPLGRLCCFRKRYDVGVDRAGGFLRSRISTVRKSFGHKNDMCPASRFDKAQHGVRTGRERHGIDIVEFWHTNVVNQIGVVNCMLIKNSPYKCSHHIGVVNSMLIENSPQSVLYEFFLEK